MTITNDFTCMMFYGMIVSKRNNNVRLYVNDMKSIHLGVIIDVKYFRFSFLRILISLSSPTSQQLQHLLLCVRSHLSYATFGNLSIYCVYGL